jgi:very-short-patch-repair endonuclease
MSEKTQNRRTHAKRPLTDVARALRRNETDAEKRLWYHFRDGRFLGYKFRRQTPRGRAVADLLCHEARLIVEVDGGQHASSSSDVERTAFLNSAGYLVLRFWNNDVMSNTNGVLKEIARTPALCREGRNPSP